MLLRKLTCVAALWVTAISATAGLAQEAKELFNGKDLTGWRGKKDLWSVQDGTITGRTTPETKLAKNSFLIWDGEVADFELELDYKMIGGNSGIQYRSKVIDEAEFIVGGYQADIDASLTYAGINYEERGRGIICKRGKRSTINSEGKISEEEIAKDDDLKKVIKNEDWNHYKVVVNGNKLSHYINDTLMSETIDNQPSKAATKGVLALQIHVGPPMTVQFKNLKLKAK